MEDQPQIVQAVDTRPSWLIWVLALSLTAAGVVAYFNFRLFSERNSFKSSEPFFLADQTVWMWSQRYVNDLMVATTCPDNYQSLLSFQFPGGSYGCQCVFQGNFGITLLGMCSQNLTLMGCSNVQRASAFTVHHWDSPSQMYCIRRSNYSFLNESLLLKNASSNKKQCGSSQAGVVIPGDEDCPLQNITTDPVLLENNYRLSKGSPSYVLSFDADSPINFQSYPIVLFKATQYEFCLFYSDQAVTPNHIDSQLTVKARGCSNYSSRYQTISTTSQETFYNANSLLKQLSGKPGYSPPGSYIYRLGFINSPAWNMSCRYNIPQFSLANAVKLLSLEQDSQAAVCSYIQIAISLVLFLHSVLSLLDYLTQELKYQHFWLLIFQGLLWLSNLTVNVLSIIFTSYNISWLSRSIAMKCTDSFTINNILTAFNSYFNSQLLIDYWMMGLQLLLIIAWAIYFLLLVKRYSLSVSFWNISKPQPSIQPIQKPIQPIIRTKEEIEQSRQFIGTSFQELIPNRLQETVLEKNNQQGSFSKLQELEQIIKVKPKRKNRGSKIKDILKSLKEG